MRHREVRRNAVFSAVANPERRMILDLLRERERPAGELVSALHGLPQPAVSRHLRILRQAGLVEASPVAQQRVYSLRPERLREVDVWVSLYRRFWSDRLTALTSHLRDGGGKR